ncbi:glycosyltransferase family 4 protein [Rhodothermus marinus]|uniref:glycosyltransferase family 4 protein n=1 Tax=Rhodothermus marinus TaxID=29549 RepID=UPI001F5539E1|nr:glycosyltransferase family 4 protein [Rhodothermus marinus]
MGHEVIPFVEDNARLNGVNPLRAAVNAVWSRESQERIRQFIRERKPDVAHFHNTFLMISPAAYYACKEEGMPVVQTLHNYRLICPGALLMREGRVCEECVGRAVPWPGVLHGCWRGSRLQTSVVAAMLTLHRAMKTWTEQVDCYIALTEFARRKFIEGGLPAEKIVVKPNFVDPDPGMGKHEGNFALFVGRLSPEKGVRTILQAWRLLEGVPLKVVGDGPLRAEIEAFVRREGLEQVEVLGRRPREEVFRLMQEARVLVFPSEWYEGFPMTIAEAFACGLPVIASRLGAIAEIVEEGRTGLLFNPGSPEDLAAKVEWAWAHPRELAEMGREARREYEQKYTAEKNYEMLMAIYERARNSG